MSKKQKNEKEIFEEALADSLQAQLKAVAETAGLEKETLLPIIKERLEEGETQWDLLRRMIDGSMTERFLRAIDGMSDKEFVRNYLKLLEHFKPKITRTEPGEDDKRDNTINVQIVMLDEKGEQKILDITEYQNGNLQEPSEEK